jgi:hypothetical protein
MVTSKATGSFAYNNNTVLQNNMSGRCDSLHSGSKTAITNSLAQLFSERESQITGDLMHLIGNAKTDS